MSNFTITIGGLFRNQVRNFLRAEKFKGNIDDFIENKYFLCSEFIAKGKDSDKLREVYNTILEWGKK